MTSLLVNDFHPSHDVYLGCMTGTSADQKADLTAAQFDAQGRISWLKHYSHLIPSDCSDICKHLSQRFPENISQDELNACEHRVTDVILQAYQAFLQDPIFQSCTPEQFCLSPHGQTLIHQPFARPPVTLQCINAETLADQLGMRVISKHRNALLPVCSAAPLAPVLVKHLFVNASHHTVLVNGGGIANFCLLTQSPENKLVAWDTGPANITSDALIQEVCRENPERIPVDLRDDILTNQFDFAGRWAKRGQVLPGLKTKLLAHPYFSLPPCKKSAEASLFTLAWIHDAMDWRENSLEDCLATISSVVAESICDAVTQALSQSKALGTAPSRIAFYGGMIYHETIMQQCRERLSTLPDCHLFCLNDVGLNPNYVESTLMALLGYYADKQIPIDVSYCQRDGIMDATAVPGLRVLPRSVKA